MSHRFDFAKQGSTAGKDGIIWLLAALSIILMMVSTGKANWVTPVIIVGWLIVGVITFVKRWKQYDTVAKRPFGAPNQAVLDNAPDSIIGSPVLLSSSETDRFEQLVRNFKIDEQ